MTTQTPTKDVPESRESEYIRRRDLAGTRWCASIVNPRPAVIGEHTHWNGDFYEVCPYGSMCERPSCHPAELADYIRTLKDVRWQLHDREGGCAEAKKPYVVTWQEGNGWFRRTCTVCGSEMEKDNVVAFFRDRDGDEHEMCDGCVAAGPDVIRMRCRDAVTKSLASAVEQTAATFSAASLGEWVVPSLEEGQRMRRERDAELDAE